MAALKLDNHGRVSRDVTDKLFKACHKLKLGRHDLERALDKPFVWKQLPALKPLQYDRLGLIVKLAAQLAAIRADLPPIMLTYTSKKQPMLRLIGQANSHAELKHLYAEVGKPMLQDCLKRYGK